MINNETASVTSTEPQSSSGVSLKEESSVSTVSSDSCLQVIMALETVSKPPTGTQDSNNQQHQNHHHSITTPTSAAMESSDSLGHVSHDSKGVSTATSSTSISIEQQNQSPAPHQQYLQQQQIQQQLYNHIPLHQHLPLQLNRKPSSSASYLGQATNNNPTSQYHHLNNHNKPITPKLDSGDEEDEEHKIVEVSWSLVLR
jgi:hypothetical protein